VDSADCVETSQIDNTTEGFLAGITETDQLAVNNLAVDWEITARNADVGDFRELCSPI